MNLHATIPIEEMPAAPADPVAQMLDAAKISTEAELLDALEHRRTQIGLSLASFAKLSGLAAGHPGTAIGPARTKSPSARTLYRMLDALALSIVLVVDGAKAERVQPQWRPRDERKVRVRAMSPTTIARAKPHVVSELLRRASRPRWQNTSARDFLRALTQEADA
jgi:transcriptional regulator with XRE-family HTH domain